MSDSSTAENAAIKFVRTRQLIGESGAPRAGAAFEYEVGTADVTVEIGSMKRSEEELKCVAEEYIRREQLRAPLKNGTRYQLSTRDVEGLELFMRGSGEAR